MPVNRAYINGFATANGPLYQALSALANQSDALEKAAGLVLGTSSGSQASSPAPAAAQWTITARNGHFLVQITNPASATAPVQHQVRSGLNQNFDANASVASYTLGFGQTTLDVIDPNEARFWQIQSRYQGSAWNGWSTYTGPSGAMALNAGALKTQ